MSEQNHVTLDTQLGSIQLPVIRPVLGVHGIDVSRVPQDPGYCLYDPGLAATATCKSAITYVDGQAGVLMHRGYRIEELVRHARYLEVSYLLMHGELPTAEELSCFEQAITQHAWLDDPLERFLDGFQRDSHPMAILAACVAWLAARHYNPQALRAAPERRQAAIRLIAQMPILAATIYRRVLLQVPMVNHASLSRDYSERCLQVLLGSSDQVQGLPPIAIRAMDVLFMLHADHEQNASTSTVRLVGSTGASPYASIAAGIAALWGPAHGGANEAVLNMLEHIATPDRVSQAIARAKDKQSSFRLMGFGHRVYKNFDPRAHLIRELTHQVLKELDVQDPLFDVARALEDAARQDDYFIERQLYPNVDFYSGLIYRALQIPTRMFTVMFAIARTSGWVSHWLEQQVDPDLRIGRPRQLYVGYPQRRYPPR